MRDWPEVATMIGELNKRIAELEEKNAKLSELLLEITGGGSRNYTAEAIILELAKAGTRVEKLQKENAELKRMIDIGRAVGYLHDEDRIGWEKQKRLQQGENTKLREELLTAYVVLHSVYITRTLPNEWTLSRILDGIAELEGKGEETCH